MKKPYYKVVVEPTFPYKYNSFSGFVDHTILFHSWLYHQICVMRSYVSFIVMSTFLI